ncbi:MAG: YqgE/AlgH family protein [Pseudomonadota bacterium]
MTSADATETSQVSSQGSLEHHFLLAMPSQIGSYFGDTLIYLCRHNADGAFGLIVNRTLELDFADLLRQLNIDLASTVDHPVYAGGPVRDEQGLVLHSDECRFPESDPIGNGLCLTLSTDILSAIGRGEGPRQMLFSLGYAGWGAGQLEDELAADAWVAVRATADLLFDVPSEVRLELAAQRNGIRLNRLGGHIGRC